MVVKAYSYARWSSGRQREGNSLERQLSAAVEYAADKGFDLDTSMVDDAVSAYRGKNRLKGELARFKERIAEGAIPRGSYFLIDSYDRFSREEPNVSVASLLEIVNAGVHVVTLSNKMVLSGGSSSTELLMAVMDLHRAHNESVEKGRKIQIAHDRSKKRAREELRAWTPVAPSWLAVDDVGFGLTREIKYKPILERVALIQEMFDMFESGMSTKAIANAFNTRTPPVPTNYQFERMQKPTTRMGKPRVRKDSGEWSADTITTTLSNRAVLGEHQQMVTDPDSPQGRRKLGEPIPGFYGKAVIDETQFLRVQAKIGEKKRGPRQRGSMTFNNLFIGIGWCGECGKRFSLHSNLNSDSRHRTSRMRCIAAQQGGRCTNRLRMPYVPLEEAFLTHVVDFEVPTNRPKLDVDAQELEAAKLKHDDLVARCRKMSLEIFEADRPNPYLQELLDQKTAEVANLTDRIKELHARVGSVARLPSPTDHLKAISTLREQLDGMEGEALYALRANLAQNISAVVEKMVFDPDGAVMVYVKGLANFYLFKDGGFVGKGDDTVMRLVRRAAANAGGGHDSGAFIRRTGEGSTQFILGPAKKS